MHYLIIPAYFILWLVTARIHYRCFAWRKKTEDDDRRLYAGMWGLMWPLALLGWIIAGVCWVVGQAETFPSLAERRENKIYTQKQKLHELDEQIKVAEAGLAQATEEQEKTQKPDKWETEMDRKLHGAY